MWSKQQSKRGGVLSPVVWFLMGWGVVIGLLLVIAIVQDVDLSSQLTASAPSGSPNACYLEGSCNGSISSAKQCKLMAKNNKYYHYWIGGEGCRENARLIANSIWNEGCTLDPERVFADQKVKCTNALLNIGCPSGSSKIWWGLPETLTRRKKIPYSLNYECDTTCNGVVECVAQTGSESPVPSVYVSIDNAEPVTEGAGFSKSYFHLQVHDKNKSAVANHGGVTVKYHTEDGSLTDVWGDAAKEGEDYEGVNTSVTIPDLAARMTVSVEILNDDDPENKEAFRVKLDSVTGGGVAIRTGYGVIVDDDGSPSSSPTPSI